MKIFLSFIPVTQPHWNFQKTKMQMFQMEMSPLKTYAMKTQKIPPCFF